MFGYRVWMFIFLMRRGRTGMVAEGERMLGYRSGASGWEPDFHDLANRLRFE